MIIGLLQGSLKGNKKYRAKENSYVDSERGLRNWAKQQKKLLNAGALEGQRLMMFNELLGLGEKYKRVNQYQ